MSAVKSSSPIWLTTLITAYAPMIWGTTYLTTTEFLPPDRPFLAGAVRSLPAGLALLLLVRRLPKGAWWWRSQHAGLHSLAVDRRWTLVDALGAVGGRPAAGARCSCHWRLSVVVDPRLHRCLLAVVSRHQSTAGVGGVVSWFVVAGGCHLVGLVGAGSGAVGLAMAGFLVGAGGTVGRAVPAQMDPGSV